MGVNQRYLARWSKEYRNYSAAKAGILLKRGWELPHIRPVADRTYCISICTGIEICPGGGKHSVKRAVSELKIRCGCLDVVAETKKEAWRHLREYFIENDLI